MQPDLTAHGLECLATAVRKIISGEASKVDLGHGTVVHRTRDHQDGSYDIVTQMRIEKED